MALLLTACASENRGGEAPQQLWDRDPRPLGETLVYECHGYGGAGYQFIARLGPGEMAVWLEDRYLILSRERSTSQVNYREGEVIFRLRGEEASLELGGEHYRNCVLAPGRAPWEDARRRGVNFRATGNEPGWHLEIQRGQHILFVGDYGMHRVLLQFPEEIPTVKRRIFQARDRNNHLRVEFVEQVCADTMADENYPLSVAVELDGRQYAGCGMELHYPWEK